VLDRAILLEGGQDVGRQQLRQHAGHHLERQPVGRDVDGARTRHDVWPLSDVHDQRIAIGADNRGEKGFNQSHTSHNCTRRHGSLHVSSQFIGYCVRNR
jgi:hypothetical protein